MAIYHVHISSGSRADGQSAAVKVTYILREGAYGGRDDLVCWGSGNMPSWAAADPRQLFEAADLYERANGRLFVHVWVALPNELTESERHELGLAIAAALTAAGLPFVYSIHAGDPKSPGEPANPHIHIVISERVNDNIPRDARQWFRRSNPREPARGGAAKDRRLKEVTWVDDARRVVARLTNEHLALAGCKARVTADSHEVRIVEAEAWGDTETADVLRQHPPGVHLGPAAAAIERDRSGGKRDEVPKVLRQGEPTERGDLARAKAAEEERVRGDLERVSAKLRRAREEEVRATESVAAARSAGLSEDRILAVYEESESTAEGSGWAAVEEAASSEAGRKKEAEGAAAATAREWLVDVDAVCGGARDRNEDELDALEQETAAAKPVVAAARAAGLDDAAIGRIYREAESQEYGSGWAAVTRATGERVQRKSAAEAAARGLDLSVEFIYANASHGADPVDHLERVTAIWGRARRAGLNNKQLDDIYGRAENRQVGTGWTVIEDATAKRVQRKLAAEALARGVVVDVDAVCGGARDRNEDELDALEQETAAAKPVVAAARAAGLDDAAIGRIYREAESQEYGSGWAAVTRATGERVQRKSAAEAAARGLDLSVEFIYANASHGADPVDHLERVTAIWGRARRAGLNNKQLDDIYGRAENRQVGTGWTVIEDATAKRVQRKLAAEALARGVVVDVDAVYRCARDRNEDELDALEQETAAAKPVVAAARAAGLDDAAIGRIYREAESQEYGSGWAAVTRTTGERVQRKSAAEAAARGLDLSVEFIYANASHGADPVDHLERVTAIWGRARRAGLNNKQLDDIYGRAENRQVGTGWTVIEDATAKRVQRKLAAEALARGVVVDVDAVYRCARDRNEDELDALEQETAAAKPVVASARAAGLGDAAIGRIRDAAESTERGSGWAAVSKATEDRNKRRAAAEMAAGEWLVDIDAVRRDARDRSEDELDALEQATAAARPVVASARAAGLGDAAIGRIRDAAESTERGSGWAAVSKATEDRNKRRAAAEMAAGEWLVDVDAVRRDARDRNDDELDALEAATAAARPVVASARAAGLDDAAIGRIRDEAESTERGSGWAAVSKATEDRNERRSAAEAAAEEWLVDIDAVRRDARDRNDDELDALEAATAAARPVVAAARAAGLDDAAIGRIRDEAESTERGSGWAAVSKATEDRNERRSAAEAAAEEWLVDVDAVRRDARDRNDDELDALEAATAAARPVVVAARAAGLDDATIGRIRDEAESTERGSGWAAVSKATEDRNKRRSAAEAAAEEWLVDIDAVRRDARDRNVKGGPKLDQSGGGKLDHPAARWRV